MVEGYGSLFFKLIDEKIDFLYIVGEIQSVGFLQLAITLLYPKKNLLLTIICKDNPFFSGFIFYECIINFQF
jgi:hypothetical protein